MLGEETLKRAAQRALRHGKGKDRQVEVVLLSSDGALTRFANNEIHQHVAERDVSVHVRVAIGQRVGSASANGLDDETLQRVVERATTVAALQPENPDFPGLPGPFQSSSPSTLAAACAASTLEATPEARAERVAIVCRRAEAAGLTAAGACSTAVEEVLVANSLGTLGYHAGTQARLQAVIMSDTSSGYSVRQGADFAGLDAEQVAAEAAGKAERGRNPDDLEPGEYDVVLEPYATEDVVRFIAYLGLHGRAIQEKTSFATGRLGERLLGEPITLVDDPLDPAGLIQPFDFEGVPKRPLTLVDRGVVTAVTYDTLTAAKAVKAGIADARTTGHALLGQGYYGPVATNLSLQAGALTREQLIGTIDRGLLVTRFWYTRAVHPLTVTVTGMTRDSTFLIERGEITRPVKNLRFTQSYVAALQNVAGVGAEPLLVGDSYGSPLRAPALALRGFTFTGKSEY